MARMGHRYVELIPAGAWHLAQVMLQLWSFHLLFLPHQTQSADKALSGRRLVAWALAFSSERYAFEFLMSYVLESRALEPGFNLWIG